MTESPLARAASMARAGSLASASRPQVPLGPRTRRASITKSDAKLYAMAQAQSDRRSLLPSASAVILRAANTDRACPVHDRGWCQCSILPVLRRPHCRLWAPSAGHLGMVCTFPHCVRIPPADRRA